MVPLARRRPTSRWAALALGLALFAIYNANGREIGTVDSQPVKYTAVELAAHGDLQLDRIVAEKPGLGERAEFARDRRGHFRSARPIAPAMLAALPALVLRGLGADLDAPLASNLVAKLTASACVAAAVALVFVTLRRISTRGVALVTSVGLGLGTNYWALVSQTLWQHETVALGMGLMLWAWCRPLSDVHGRALLFGGLGLAMAGAARPQVAPMVLVLLTAALVRHGRRGLIPLAIVAAVAGVSAALNMRWFGNPLGGLFFLQALNPSIHGEASDFTSSPWAGAAGLLISPSRGLLVFSPIVAVVVVGARAAWQDRSGLGLRGFLLAALAQSLLYAFFSVWWAGHTFGPRFALDVLIPLTPAAALGVARLSTRPIARAAGVLLLAWSIAIAGLGAFVYPNEVWNTSPFEINRDHARLWDVRDSQIVRAAKSSLSPQNFDLFTMASVRKVGQR